MAKQRYINTHFWDDTFVVDLDPIEKLLFLYVLTNPLTNIAGAYEVSIRRVAFDTGIDKEMILKIFARFEKSNKVIYRDGWILILNFIKNQSLNPKMLAGIEEIVKHCPDWVKDRLSIAYESLSHLNLNRHSITTDNGEPIGGTVAEEKEETQEEFLIRLQLENPKKNVQVSFKEYVADCKKRGWQPKRQLFIKWLANSFEPMTPPEELKVSELPTPEEVIKKREEFNKKQQPVSPETFMQRL